MGVAAISLFFFTSSTAFAADGWASMNGDTTGGAGGTTVTVSNATDFKTYVESTDTYIVQVSGTIDLNSIGGRVRIRSNKTIKGVDPPNATIIGELGFKFGSSNVIIEGLNITNPAYAYGDGISVKEDINNVFITKCTVYDCFDGCIDITRRSDWVTVSWCKFYYTSDTGHNFVHVIGTGDSADLGKLNVTFHHNWWYTLCKQRMPRVDYASVHVYNNYYDCPGNDYATGLFNYAEVLIENNYYDSIDDPYYIISGNGKIEAYDNVFVNCTGQIHDGDDTVFTPPYSYMLNDANDVPDIVQAYAGADNPEPPHWLVTLYGDFDINGVVDENDLETFADYWLQTSDIDDADYFDNGRVDGREFALFAQNWREPSEP